MRTDESGQTGRGEPRDDDSVTRPDSREAHGKDLDDVTSAPFRGEAFIDSERDVDAAAPGQADFDEANAAVAPEGETEGEASATHEVGGERATDAEKQPDPRAPAVAEPFGIPMDTWVGASPLGGFVYIVNLLNALGWTGLPGPGDAGFRTRVRGEAGPWAVLEAVLRAMLADDLDAYADDPLWEALSRLDGRDDGTVAGAELSALTAFVAPPDAVEQAGGPGGEIYWFADRGRLRVWSPRLLLADVPVESASTDAGVAERAHALGSIFQKTMPDARALTPAEGPDPWHDVRPLPGVSPALRQWTCRAMPLIRYRLREALGRENDDPLGDLLTGEATLHLTPMHVDVTLPLDAVSLEVRLAGLDRDPGWLPDFGRVVHLHFS
jgi:hypothetical protein